MLVVTTDLFIIKTFYSNKDNRTYAVTNDQTTKMYENSLWSKLHFFNTVHSGQKRNFNKKIHSDQNIAWKKSCCVLNVLGSAVFKIDIDLKILLLFWRIRWVFYGDL